MAIIGSLPVQLANNTLADATQVMSDFNYVVTQVNSNAAGLAGTNNFTGTNTISGDAIVTATATQTLTNKTLTGVSYTASAQPGFSVQSGTTNQTSGAYVLFANSNFDTTSAVTASVFTAPVAGIYLLTATITIVSGVAGWTDNLIFQGSVSNHGFANFTLSGAGQLTVVLTSVAKLALSETIKVALKSGGSFSASQYIYNSYPSQAQFSGAQIA